MIQGSLRNAGEGDISKAGGRGWKFEVEEPVVEEVMDDRTNC